MIDLDPAATLLLAYVLFYLIVVLVALWTERTSETDDVLSRLHHSDRTDCVRKEASLWRIRRSVREADPAMPEDSIDLDFEFYDRAN